MHCIGKIYIPFQDIFDVFENTHAYDGTFSSGDDTLTACRAACLASRSCVAFDFDGGCFHHFDIANLEEVNTNANNVAHYRRRANPNCAPTADATGTGVSGTGSDIQCTILDTYEPAQRNTAHSSYGSGTSLETVTSRSLSVSDRDVEV